MTAEKGFTLTELLLATAILAIAIIGLLNTYLYCILMNETNTNLVTAVGDAQFVLEQMQELPYSGIATYNPPLLDNLNNESISLTRNIRSGYTEVTVDVSWTERQRQRSFSLSTSFVRSSE